MGSMRAEEGEGKRKRNEEGGRRGRRNRGDGSGCESEGGRTVYMYEVVARARFGLLCCWNARALPSANRPNRGARMPEESVVWRRHRLVDRHAISPDHLP